MYVSLATDQNSWDAFLRSQTFSPFLQSWTMGEVYRRIGQEPIRLIVQDGCETRGICFAHVVPARRGRHLSIPYGPVFECKENSETWNEITVLLTKELKKIARENFCSFIRLSPFWPISTETNNRLKAIGATPSPLHLLGEYLWYLPLTEHDTWHPPSTLHFPFSIAPRSEDELFTSMRSTTRNLIRRAEKEGVIISKDAVDAFPLFLKLHEETCRRHRFTPYTDAFFRAQVEEFSKTKNVILYLARHQGNVIASSIHMTFGGETSYHHGASVAGKIPASYLLQWTAIKDALKRGDHVYNFWGIAPVAMNAASVSEEKWKMKNARHPFAGVTLFKTGFGGKLLTLAHCMDIAISPKYYFTRVFEIARKCRRGF